MSKRNNFKNIKNKKKSKQTEKIEEDEFLKSLQSSIENYQEFSKNLLKNTDPKQFEFNCLNPLQRNISKYFLKNHLDILLGMKGFKKDLFLQTSERDQILFIDTLLNDEMSNVSKYFYDTLTIKRLRKIRERIIRAIDKSINRWKDKNLQEYSITINNKERSDEVKEFTDEEVKKSEENILKSGTNLKVIDSRTDRDSLNFIDLILHTPEAHKVDQISSYIGNDYRYALTFDMDFKEFVKKYGEKALTIKVALKLAEEAINRVCDILGIDFRPTLIPIKLSNAHLHFWYVFDNPIHKYNWSRNYYTDIPEEEEIIGLAYKTCFLFVGRVLSCLFEHADPHHTFGMGKNFINMKTHRHGEELIYESITFDSEGKVIDKEGWIEGTYKPSLKTYAFEDILRSICLNIDKINQALPREDLSIPYSAFLILKDLELDKSTFKDYVNTYYDNYTGKNINDIDSNTLDLILRDSLVFNHLNLKTYEGNTITSHKFYEKMVEQINKINNLLPISQDDLMERLLFDFKYPSLKKTEVIKGSCVRHNPSYINASRFVKDLFLDGILNLQYTRGIELSVEVMKFYQYYILPFTNTSQIEEDKEIISTARCLWNNVKAYATVKKSALLKKYHFCMSYYSYNKGLEPSIKGRCQYTSQQREYGCKRNHFNALINSLSNLYSISKDRKIRGKSKNYIKKLKSLSPELVLEEITSIVREELEYYFKNNGSPKTLMRKLRKLLIKLPLIKSLAKDNNIDINELLFLINILNSLFKKKEDEEYTYIEKVNYFNRRYDIKGKIKEKYSTNKDFFNTTLLKKTLYDQNLTIEDINNYFDIKNKIIA